MHAPITIDEAANRWQLTEDIVYCDAFPDVCRLDIFHPKEKRGAQPNAALRPVMLYIHGGGLVEGTRKWIADVYKLLGCVIVSIDYRMYPDAKWPDFVNDAACAVAWVRAHIDAFGGDRDTIFIAGHSAGAYLATCVGIMPGFLENAGVPRSAIAGVISVSGEMVTHFRVRADFGCATDKILVNEAAPIYHISKDAPPLLLITGATGIDIGSRAADNKLMGDAMQRAGHPHCYRHELPGMGHVPVIEASYGYILEFMRIVLPPTAE